MSTKKNMTLTVPGYGSIGVYAEEISHGLKIYTNEELGTADGSVWHSRGTSGSSFSVVVVHPTYEQYTHFNEWMKVYIDRLANSSGAFGPIQVECPSRSFSKIALPISGVQFGRDATDFIWRQTLAFKGGIDMVSYSDDRTISAAYAATYYEGGGNPGDYISNYAIANIGDALFPTRFENIYNYNGWSSDNPFVTSGLQ